MTMPDRMPTVSITKIKRRNFFGRTLSGIAGGIVSGNYLGTFFSTKRSAGKSDVPVRIAPNPDSVPRTSKGVK